MPETINTAKLRRILRAVHDQGEAYRALSDRSMSLRDEIERKESSLQQAVRSAGLPKLERKRRENAIDALREESRQLAEHREYLSESGHRDAIPKLVNYARRAGYVVDEQACTVRPKFEGEPGKVHV